jgi:hypothetical protein
MPGEPDIAYLSRPEERGVILVQTRGVAPMAPGLWWILAGSVRPGPRDLLPEALVEGAMLGARCLPA